MESKPYLLGVERVDLQKREVQSTSGKPAQCTKEKGKRLDNSTHVWELADQLQGAGVGGGVGGG